jgi:hypothetical protein
MQNSELGMRSVEFSFRIQQHLHCAKRSAVQVAAFNI